MLIRCPDCQFERYVDETKIPPKAQVATCPKCKQKFRFREHSIPEEPQNQTKHHSVSHSSAGAENSPVGASSRFSAQPSSQRNVKEHPTQRSSMPAGEQVTEPLGSIPSPSPAEGRPSGVMDTVRGDNPDTVSEEPHHALEHTTGTAHTAAATLPENQTGTEESGMPAARPKPLKVKPVGLSPEEEAAHEKLVKALREGKTITQEEDIDSISGDAETKAPAETIDESGSYDDGEYSAFPHQSGNRAAMPHASSVSEQEEQDGHISGTGYQVDADRPDDASGDSSGDTSGDASGAVSAGKMHHTSQLPSLDDPQKDKGDIWDAIAAMGGTMPEDDTFEPDMPEGVPWEHISRLGFGAALYQTARKVLRTPGHFFASMGETGGSSALVFFLVSALIGSHLNLLWSLLAGSFMGEQAVFSQNLMESFSLVHYAVSLAMLMLVQLFCFYGMSVVYHLFIRLITGKKHAFSTTMRVIGYSGATSLAAIIPLVGSVGGFLWFFALTIIGTKHAHRLQWKQTILALLPFYMLGLSIMAFLYRAMTMPVQ